MPQQNRLDLIELSLNALHSPTVLCEVGKERRLVFDERSLTLYQQGNRLAQTSRKAVGLSSHDLSRPSSSLLRRRCRPRVGPRALDEPGDVVLQLLVLRRTDVNHVAGFVVAVRHAIDDLLLVR